MPTLVLATGNAGKATEVRAALPGVTVETLADHPGLEIPGEDGETFVENARIKALAVARALGRAVLADDSGLVVDALGGRPGVRSARYAEGSDRDRYEKLLVEMERVPEPGRTARFVCAMALATPDGDVMTAEGTCEGRIARVPRGEGGFGYDPVFRIGAGERTMAELTSVEKNAISHRGRALVAMRPHLLRHFSLEQP